MYNRYNDGWIEVITGCMFAGKTEEFIRRIIRLQYAHRKVLVFKPSIDIRYSATRVMTHKGVSIEAIMIDRNKPEEILNILKAKENQDVAAIAVDEVQFFNKKIIEILTKLANNNKQVIVAGLDQDFRAEPFPVMAEILPIAEFVTKLDAICVICGAAATRTQKIINGKEAKYNDPIIEIGAQEKYEARCREHHKVLK
ncbi:MAG: thymidine kinase [Spiroplasma sp.]|nr:thymidine kinase [Spiroplasma sp.]